MEKSITPELSIVIVSYKTPKLLIECIESIVKTAKGFPYEIIVSDNDSNDGTIEALKEYKTAHKTVSLVILDNKKNLGFSKGNNVGIKASTGRYLLFLNPDTVVHEKTLNTMIEFMDNHQDGGAATCKLELPGGGIDEGSHRGFPTPWNAFSHFTGLEKLFPGSRLFSGYTQGWKNLDTVHTVDAIVGAFMIVPRIVGEKVGWWDEDFFFYGEDLDLCFKIRKAGFKIYYVPTVSILHYGGVSSGIKKSSESISVATNETRKMLQNARFDAMRIFYRKHYVSIYPKFVTWLVLAGINYLHKKNISKLK